jgi:hypothetical protein
MTIDPRRYVWCTVPELPDWCAIPGCTNSFKLQKHHIVRRSATGGPLDYITIDGLVVQNICNLCREHHAEITGSLGGHKLWIVWERGRWQVYRPGYDLYADVRRSKNGESWIRSGPLRIGKQTHVSA